MSEARYTAAEVAALLCDGCRHGLPLRRSGRGRMHMLGGLEVAPCHSTAWAAAHARELSRRRMVAARARARRA